jgi:hypothetical protein
MRAKVQRLLLLLIAIVLVTPNNSIAAINAGDPCATKGEKRVEGSTTYVCAPLINDPTKLMWGRLLSESKPVPKATTKPTAKASSKSKSTTTKTQTPVASSNQPIIVVQSTPKPIPLLIPNTNTPWPKPTGDLFKYSGVGREQHANDQLGLAGLHSGGITGKGYSIAFIDNSIDTISQGLFLYRITV